MASQHLLHEFAERCTDIEVPMLLLEELSAGWRVGRSGWGRSPLGWRNGEGTGARVAPWGLVGLGLSPQVCGYILWNQMQVRLGGRAAGVGDRGWGSGRSSTVLGCVVI